VAATFGLSTHMPFMHESAMSHFIAMQDLIGITCFCRCPTFRDLLLFALCDSSSAICCNALSTLAEHIDCTCVLRGAAIAPQVHYVADSETEQVEWFSALEGAVAKIVRAVAGLEEEDSTPAVSNRSSSSGRDRDWANQLEKGFASISKGSSGRPDGNAMVNIVGYSGATAPPAARRSESFAADNGNYGSTISYGQIDGNLIT